MWVEISTVDSVGPRISMQPEKDSQLQYHVHHVPRDPLLIKESSAYNNSSPTKSKRPALEISQRVVQAH
jgi:hypothetical protein